MGKIIKNVTSLFLSAVTLGGCFVFTACGEVFVSSSPDSPATGSQSQSVQGSTSAPSQESPQKSGVSLPEGEFANLSVGVSATDGQGLTIFDDTGWRDVPSPFENSFIGVANKEGFVALVQETIDGTTLAITLDDGKNWKTEAVDVPDGFSCSALCFYSADEGYLAMSNSSTGNSLLVAISTGGDNTGKKVISELPGVINEISLASAQVGWVSCGEILSEFPYSKTTLLQTRDGGQNWQPVKFTLTEEMETDLVEFSAEVPHWKNNRWECEVEFDWWGQFLGNSRYTFAYDEKNESWSWQEPNWQVSKEINKIRLMEYLWCVVLPQAEFNAENPTKDDIAFASRVPMCQTSDYLKRIGYWSIDYLEKNRDNYDEWVSPEILQPMQLQFYGIADLELDLTEWGEGTYSDLGMKVHYYHEHGFDYPHREIREVRMLNDTDFSVDMDVYTPMSTDGPNGFPKLEKTIRCVFKLQPVGQAQIFTLLSQTVVG